MGVRVGRCRAFCSLVFTGALLCSVIILWEGGGGAIPNATLSPGKGGGGGVQSVLFAGFHWSSAVFCYYTVGGGRGSHT